jgi:hypothetical protein
MALTATATEAVSKVIKHSHTTDCVRLLKSLTVNWVESVGCTWCSKDTKCCNSQEEL